mmetsp:Transcript_17883/g.22026  ORF Transcript_17883/g.22026 Transcript_17883/m.22026 type:complete len:385 (+) Transcript_17883:155-1309(+)|eukprot:CAMPEP_0204856368 /NCGR_PEP_ID=MMETSP1347-20130617/18310_1 /ASSEMBLY_ACC=CAM_ASM_000690 /TAXON_ID=215587 /ORGANISM="Aplanochytrium stocchinoi, Strain GSBS06" /LENGTH=384 /DNA_ID=CAMNT_0052003009 /DNA_START=96 /DNA_END=1250 /DNA_ORIENTATION=-
MGFPRSLFQVPAKLGAHLSTSHRKNSLGCRRLLFRSLSSTNDDSFTNVRKIKAKVKSKVVIKSEWTDKVTFSLTAARIDFDESNGLLEIVSEENTDLQSVDLSVPERINLEIYCLSGDVEIRGKMEGDVRIECKNGNISLDKIRGDRIYLRSNGSVDVSKNVEGTEIEIESKSFRAKRVMGNYVSVKCEDDVEIVSSYAGNLNISTQENVTLGAVHSNLSCSSKALAIHGMNGSVSTTCRNNIELYFDTFAQNSCSDIRSTQGDILLAIPQVNEVDSSVLIEAAAKEIEQQHDAFKVVSSLQEQHDIVPFTKITLSPLMLSEAKSGNGQVGSGKINIEEAAKEIYGKQKTSGNIHQMIQIEALQGKIKLEQLGWMDRIKKQFLK